MSTAGNRWRLALSSQKSLIGLRNFLRFGPKVLSCNTCITPHGKIPSRQLLFRRHAPHQLQCSWNTPIPNSSAPPGRFRWPPYATGQFLGDNFPRH